MHANWTQLTVVAVLAVGAFPGIAAAPSLRQSRRGP